MVTLIDGRWGQRFTAWVVHGGRYVAGLRPWYEQHKLPAGAYIVLERRDNSGEIVVDFKPKRMRREWMRKAQVVDGQIDIQLRKGEVSCEYDELTIIGDERPEELAQAAHQPDFRQPPSCRHRLRGLRRSGGAEPKRHRSCEDDLQRGEPGAALSARSDFCNRGD